MNSTGCYYQPFNKKGFHSSSSLGGWFQVANAGMVDILLSHVSCGFSSLSSAPPTPSPTHPTQQVPSLSPAASHLSGRKNKASEKQRYIESLTLSLIDLYLTLFGSLKKPNVITLSICNWRFAVLLDLCGKESPHEGKTGSSLIRKFYYSPRSPR